MINDKKLTVSASPHVRSSSTSTGIMLDVIIALVPALIASVTVFGSRALIVTAVSVASCMLAEFVSRRVMKRPGTLGDLSAVVTGILLAFNLPVSIPIWMVVIGAVVAIVVVKQMFGGLGQNFVNPALIGRIVLFVSFPTAMTTWSAPFAYRDADAIAQATPLAKISSGAIDSLPDLTEMLFGIREGCLGEGCAIALILGGLYLVFRKVISPAIPLCYIGTVAAITLLADGADFVSLAYKLMGGGLLLGAIFMATDYATSPLTLKGKIIFGVGCGAITGVIRIFGNMEEGVSFSIIIMNILVPHIERLTTPKPFGTLKLTKEEKLKLAQENKALKDAEKAEEKAIALAAAEEEKALEEQLAAEVAQAKAKKQEAAAKKKAEAERRKAASAKKKAAAKKKHSAKKPAEKKPVVKNIPKSAGGKKVKKKAPAKYNKKKKKPHNNKKKKSGKGRR